MRSVLEGGVGCISGGMEDRSRDIFFRDSRDAGRDGCGELSDEDMATALGSPHFRSGWRASRSARA